jgi:hypothetical protein
VSLVGRIRTTAVAVLAFAGVVVVSAPVAHADDDDRLPLPAFGDVVVDQVHQKVFVSGGPTTNGIVVTDFRGKVVKQINGQPGATGLELSADSATLYVALAAGDAISAISTTTYTETARHAVGPQTCPTHLARTGSVVWFGYGCEADWNAKIGRFDPAATPPVDISQPFGGATFQRAPLLESNGTGPLVAGQLSLSLSTVRVFTVDGGNLAAGASGDVVGASLTDLSLNTAGTLLFSASGSRSHVEAFAPGDLSRRGSYSTGPRPSSAAVSPDDAFVATAVTTSGDKDVQVYRVDGTLPVRTVDIARTEIVAARGLAWSGDLKKLFFVSQAADHEAPRLNIVDNPIRD